MKKFSPQTIRSVYEHLDNGAKTLQFGYFFLAVVLATMVVGLLLGFNSDFPVNILGFTIAVVTFAVAGFTTVILIEDYGKLKTLKSIVDSLPRNL